LKLDPVHQKDRQGHLVLADVVQEHVLEVLSSFGCHGWSAFLFFELAQRDPE